MKDEEINKILEITKKKIAISQLKKEERKLNNKKGKIKSVAAACLMIVSFSGIVFAKDISNKIYQNFFLTGNGVESAINNGYIEETNMEGQNSNSEMKNEETGKVITDTQTSVKVEEFLMDDFNLSMTFVVTLSDETKQIISAQNIWEMNFPDLKITDENNQDVISGSGLNYFISEKKDNVVKVVYNLYTGGENLYPKSKKLNVKLSKIKISDKDETLMGDEEITLSGDWNFTIDVPEKMYNRKSISYKQISTTNKDFNVLSATLYDTGMDIKLKFKARKHEKEPTTDKIEFWNSLSQDDELKSLDILNYIGTEIKYTKEYTEYLKREFDIWDYEKYITNEEGKTFKMSQGPRENGGGYIDDDGIYESNCTFDLTKYDATNKITVYVDYHGNKAEIVLEKVEE